VLREVRVLAAVQMRGEGRGVREEEEEERKRREEERKKKEERSVAVREWERERRERGEEVRRARAERLRIVKSKESCEESVLPKTKRTADPENDGEVEVKRRRILLDGDSDLSDIQPPELTDRVDNTETVPSHPPFNDAGRRLVKAKKESSSVSGEADTTPDLTPPPDLKKRSAPIADDCGPPSPKRIRLTSEPHNRVDGPGDFKAESIITSSVSSSSTLPCPSRNSSLATPPTSPPRASVSTEGAKQETKKVRFSAEVGVREYDVVSPVVSSAGSQGESDSAEEEESEEESENESDDGLAALIEDGLSVLEEEDDHEHEHEGEGEGEGGVGAGQDREEEEDDGLDYLFEE
jgi:hypothetical protein